MRSTSWRSKALYGTCYRKISFAGTGGANSEGDVMFLDVANVRYLTRRSAMQIAFSCQQPGNRTLNGTMVLDFDCAKLDVVNR